MSSLLKNVTDRINAQYSTGPKTLEGKAVSSQNALKHGLSAKQLVIKEEERPEFDQLQADLMLELQPQGTLEQLVFNDLIHARWKLHRCRGIEASLSTGETDPLLDESVGKQLDRILRYEARAERSFYHSLKEFRALQKARPEPAEPVPAPPPEPVTKRSQPMRPSDPLPESMHQEMIDLLDSVRHSRLSSSRRKPAVGDDPEVE
jgi:hypothetical protein